MFSYANVKNILDKNLDSQTLESSHTNKIIPLTQYRFTRDPSDYKGSIKSESFEEKLERINPSSKYGSAMLGPFYGRLADINEEEEKRESNKKGNQ